MVTKNIYLIIPYHQFLGLFLRSQYFQAFLYMICQKDFGQEVFTKSILEHDKSLRATSPCSFSKLSYVTLAHLWDRWPPLRHSPFLHSHDCQTANEPLALSSFCCWRRRDLWHTAQPDWLLTVGQRQRWKALAMESFQQNRLERFCTWTWAGKTS